MTKQIQEAFLKVSDGYSVDRVVADPLLNERFLKLCRESGLSEPAATLNLRLLNVRKSGRLTGLPKARRTSFSDEDEYRFASEVAARFLENRRGLTVDQVIADPETAREFDSLAMNIAPGYTPLQYRWAALNLRKARRLRPESVSHIVPSVSSNLGPAKSVDLNRIPVSQGIYIF